MSGLYLYQSLRGIGIEQLPGIAIASTLLPACGLFVMFVLRRHSASTRFCIWQAACGAIVLSTIVLSVSPGVPLRTASLEVSAELTRVQGKDSFPGRISPPAVIPVEDAHVVVREIATTELPKLPENALQMQTIANASNLAQQQSATQSGQVSIAARSASVPVALAAIRLVVLAFKVLSFGRSVATCYVITLRASGDAPAHAVRTLDSARRRIGLQQSPLLVLEPA